MFGVLTILAFPINLVLCESESESERMNEAEFVKQDLSSPRLKTVTTNNSPSFLTS